MQLSRTGTRPCLSSWKRKRFAFFDKVISVWLFLYEIITSELNIDVYLMDGRGQNAKFGWLISWTMYVLDYSIKPTLPKGAINHIQKFSEWNFCRDTCISLIFLGQIYLLIDWTVDNNLSHFPTELIVSKCDERATCLRIVYGRKNGQFTNLTSYTFFYLCGENPNASFSA